MTLFLTRTEDIYKLEQTLRRFEAATGARINVLKSRAMALGNWNMSNSTLDIPYHTDINVLGYHFTKSVNSAAVKTWTSVIDRMRAVAQETYHRDLNLDKRIQFVHHYLLAKIWYVTQIFPSTPDIIRRINTTITWFIWQGEICRVALSTLQREKSEGGWNLYDADAKCRALYMYRLQKESQREGTITADWVKYWNPNERPGKLPYPAGIREGMGYLRAYATEAAYVPGQRDRIDKSVQTKHIQSTMGLGNCDICTTRNENREAMSRS